MTSQCFGSIKSWNPEKGWGFIECSQTAAIYGKDVFLLKSALVGGVTVLNKGDQVAFTITDNGRGPEAAVCQRTTAAGMSNTTAQPEPGSMIGTVKSWNPQKGWGHITSDEVLQLFEKDVFVLKSQVPGGTLSKGQTVRFTVQQGQKGIEATNIQILNGGQGGQAMNGGMRNQSYGGYGQQRGQPFGGQHFGGQAFGQHFQVGHAAFPYLDAAFAAGAGVGAMPGGGKEKQHFGSIKSYNAEKGWGHIDCQQTRGIYGKDMFFLRSALNGTTVDIGDYVTFSVQQGAKGPEATNIRVVTGGIGGQFQGQVKQWNAEKNYGFISCDMTRAIYQRDIFLHSKELEGYVPKAGDKVAFTVEVSSDGRPEATGVSFPGMIGGIRAAPY
eukprot:TRINITY_DN76560_c0_g1_i1.p1 TRINITY_DN76560_c0_g1~~TRINITY_DN76560_c0_g1_i1.p1  ORF type:complete len:384 (+),score=68.77 TRINITY_DN76560_c0_g1_i1:43-1194(+)